MSETSTIVPTTSSLDNLVPSRIARQTVLTRRTAPQYLAVIHEAGLSMPVARQDVMKRQFQHRLSIGESANISLRVLPTRADANDGLRGPFMILEFAEEPALVHVDNQVTAMFLEEEPDLAGHRLAMRNILNVSLAPAATPEFITAIVADLI